MTNCNCKTACTVLAIIAGITVGIIAAILRYTAIISVFPAFFWVLFGIAVVYLGLAPVEIGIIRRQTPGYCLCPSVTAILAGALGTILTSALLLGIPFAATSAVGAVIFGFLAGFFTLLLSSMVCLVKCVAKCGYDE